jgi:beta propeller repeat protein
VKDDKRKKSLVLLALVALLVVGSTEESEEFPIAVGSGWKCFPAIYGDVVVWQDDRNGNWDIYGYDLLRGMEFPVTETIHDQVDPAIWGSMVIWEGDEDENRSIYGYNLSTGQEFLITEASGRSAPAIHGDTVVWTDYEGIYVYSLSAEKKFRIPTFCRFTRSPALYENVVLWVETRDFSNSDDIYGYDISKKLELQVATIPETQQDPAIWGDTAVWQDDRNGDWDIYGCFISTRPVARPPFIFRQPLPLPYFCAVLIGFVVIFSHFIAEWIVRTYETDEHLGKNRTNGQSREFSRSCFYSAFSMLSAILLIAMGFITLQSPDSYKDIHIGLANILLTIPFLVGFFWEMRVPYIRITDYDITIFSHVFRKAKKIAWCTIQEVKFNPGTNKIEFHLPDSSKVKVDVNMVNGREKRDLVTILSTRFSKTGQWKEIQLKY